MATARDNKEVPVVKTLFTAFERNNQFSGQPAPGYAQEAQKQMQQDQADMDSAALGQVHGAAQGPHGSSNPATAQPQGQGVSQMQRSHSRSSWPRRPQSPGPSTSSTQFLLPESNVPGGRQLSPAIGHGFITSLVTRELQSTAPPNLASGQLGAAGAPALDNGKDNAMLGVTRDQWSLFWDACVLPPPSIAPAHVGSDSAPASNAAAPAPAAAPAGVGPLGDARPCPAGSPSILPGFKQEAIYLGKFPSREQAGRAHDIAALKLHGAAASTNFAVETYAATLPVLETHSGPEVLAALRKDSDLAVQRTSKYKGVRRTAAGQYEAKADLEMVARVGGDAAVAGVVGAAAASMLAATVPAGQPNPSS